MIHTHTHKHTHNTHCPLQLTCKGVMAMVPKPSPPGVLLSSLPPLAPAVEVDGWGGDWMDWDWEWEELEDMFSPGWVTRSCFSTTILLVSFVVLKAMDLVVYGAGMPTSLKTVGGQG